MNRIALGIVSKDLWYPQQPTHFPHPLQLGLLLTVSIATIAVPLANNELLDLGTYLA